MIDGARSKLVGNVKRKLKMMYCMYNNYEDK